MPDALYQRFEGLTIKIEFILLVEYIYIYIYIYKKNVKIICDYFCNWDLAD